MFHLCKASLQPGRDAVPVAVFRKDGRTGDATPVFFGAYTPEIGQQMIREFLLLISKKNTKSTLAASIMLTELVCGWREEDENLILAPTIDVAGNSSKPAFAMIRADEQLDALLHVQEHIRTRTFIIWRRHPRAS